MKDNALQKEIGNRILFLRKKFGYTRETLAEKLGMSWQHLGNIGSQALRMAVERIPGERVYIDWAGDQLELLVDAQTGKLRKVHIFVTTVGVSSMI